MNTRIEWLRPAIPVGAFLFALLLATVCASGAHAQDNVVRVDPSGVAVAPGGTFHIGVVDDPPEQSLAAWVIELAFDPDVVTPTECFSINTPGGAVGAFACEFTDDDDDGTDETIKMLGAVLFSRSEKGLVNESKLADITFRAVGASASCTDLKLRIRIHADSDGEETGARVQDGRACVEGDAPPTGTASPFPVTPRTSEPTPVGGEDPPTIAPGGETGDETGGATQSGSSGNGGATTNPSGSGTAGTGGRTGQPTGQGEPGSNDDDDGTNTLVWVVAGLAALIIAGAGAWGIVRMRGRGSGSGPGPDA